MKNVCPKIILGRTGFEVSRIAYGGIVSGNERQEDSDRYVDYAIEHGVNYFDVAPSYGNAQEILGNSLRSRRKDVYLACKTSEFRREAGSAQFSESFRLLHTDYFDVFQLHALTTMEQLDQAFAEDGIMNVLIEAKKDGRIRNLGFSAHNEDVALEALERYDFDTVLFPFTWSLNMTRETGRRLLEVAKARNLGILALKAMALRQWQQDEERIEPKCWYKPIDIGNEELLIAAAGYSLSLGAHLFLPPGSYPYFKFAVDHSAQIVQAAMQATPAAVLTDALPDRDLHLFDRI